MKTLNSRNFFRFLIWRKANKVSIRLVVTPKEGLSQNDEVVVGFTMQYTYVNTATPDKKDPTRHALTSRVYVNAGKIESGDA